MFRYVSVCLACFLVVLACAGLAKAKDLTSFVSETIAQANGSTGSLNGIRIVYEKRSEDGDLVADALAKQGIKFIERGATDVCADAKWKRCKRANVLFCTPDLSGEALVETAIALQDAGIDIVAIRPELEPQEPDRPENKKITISATFFSLAGPMSRNEIMRVKGCKQVYQARQKSNDPIERLVQVRNSCSDRLIVLQYFYTRLGTTAWIGPLTRTIDKAGYLLDEGQSLLVTNIYRLKINAYAAMRPEDNDDDGTGTQIDPKFHWGGSPKDRDPDWAIVDGGKRYFAEFQLKPADGALTLDLSCNGSQK